MEHLAGDVREIARTLTLQECLKWVPGVLLAILFLPQRESKGGGIGPLLVSSFGLLCSVPPAAAAKPASPWCRRAQGLGAGVL
jgi:hypothetical protein